MSYLFHKYDKHGCTVAQDVDVATQLRHAQKSLQANFYFYLHEMERESKQ